MTPKIVRSLTAGLIIAISCVVAALPPPPERVFNNNFAEVTALNFFKNNDKWPSSIAELAEAAKHQAANGGRLNFDAADYKSVGFKVLENGKLHLTLTAPSGKSEVRVCDKPPTEATRIIKDEGYLIVDDGSSFYYLDTEGTFVSGPLGMCGRTLTGTYEAISPWGFKAKVILSHINRPTSDSPCEMSFEINSVERDGEEFPQRTLAMTLPEQARKRALPEKPVCRKAYFAIERLVPIEQ